MFYSKLIKNAGGCKAGNNNPGKVGEMIWVKRCCFYKRFQVAEKVQKEQGASSLYACWRGSGSNFLYQ